MGISAREKSSQYIEIEDEDEDEDSYSGSEGSDSEYDSDVDPSYSILEDTYDKFSKISLKKKSQPHVTKDPAELEDTSCKLDGGNSKEVQEFIEAGQLEKLKVEQCKIYLRNNGLRLTGNKETLIQRIKEHQEILNGGGERKYPASSFVLNCTGDACTGDVVMFEQNVYEMFSIVSHAATGPPCGTRIVAGRIVKESYGAAKQQHTFTFAVLTRFHGYDGTIYSQLIEVLWSKGEKPLTPLHPLLIKGRNLYRMKTLRQRWEDEGERKKVLMQKHLRGSLARSDRELRIKEKERRKMLKTNRIKRNSKTNKNQSQSNSNLTANSVIQSHQLGSSNVMGKAASQQHGISIDSGNMETQVQKTQVFIASRKPVIQSQQSDYSLTSVDTGRLALQPQQNRSHIQEQDRNHHQILWRTQKSDVSLGENYKRPTVNLSRYQCSTDNNNYPYMERLSESSKTSYHQSPLISQIGDNANFWQPSMYYLHKAGSMNQPANHRPRQLCRHYPKGRCYYGENCKFLHELRGEDP